MMHAAIRVFLGVGLAVIVLVLFAAIGIVRQIHKNGWNG